MAHKFFLTGRAGRCITGFVKAKASLRVLKGVFFFFEKCFYTTIQPEGKGVFDGTPSDALLLYKRGLDHEYSGKLWKNGI